MGQPASNPVAPMKLKTPAFRDLARITLLLAVAAAVSYACSESSAPKPSHLARVKIVSGDSQSGVVGTALAAPIVIQALDSNGRAAVGLSAIFGPSGDGGVSAPSVTTDSTGKASIVWTLGTTPGQQNLLATVTEPSPSNDVLTDTVYATARP